MREPVAFTPTPPREPGVVSQVFARAKAWLFGGNTIVRLGLVILFVGLAFLASYAAAAGLFPIELRLAVVALAGIALLAFGFRTRLRRPDFGLALQGAGVGTIYLTLFGAAKLIEGFPSGAAFALMVVVCALGCALALLQRSQALAVTAFAGGFATPLLLSDGSGNFAGLFAYYTVLNLAILFIAWRTSWRGLNLLGFAATFGVGMLWGLSYTDADYWPAQGFLIASVLIYVATAVLYTRGTPGKLGNVVDTTLLFGPALAGFGLQVGLVGDRPFGSAFAAIGFGALYLAVAAFTQRYRRDSFRVMNEAMLAIGIGFVTVAIPLALGARWTSAAWALEGAGAFYVGMRQARWMPRLLGLVLQLVAAAIYLVETTANVSAVPLANAAFMGGMLIALAAFATAWWLRKPIAHSGSKLANVYAGFENQLAKPAFLFGFAFWWLAWTFEATRFLPAAETDQPFMPVFDGATPLLLSMLAFVASASLWRFVGARTGWRVATWPSYASLAALVIGFMGVLLASEYVLYFPGALIWVAAIGLHLHMLYLNDRTGEHAGLLRAIHVGGVWLATAMLADSLWLAVDRAGLWDTSWAGVVFLVSATAVLGLLTWWAGRTLGRR